MYSKFAVNITGHVKIIDLTTREILVDRYNAVNAEAMSIVLADMLQGNKSTSVYELHLGNGGTVIDNSGNITYKNVEENLRSGKLAELYNPLYYKVVNTNDVLNNDDNTRNYITTEHIDGLPYTDLIITCTLERNQPESSTDSGVISFDEIGLKNKGESGLNTGYLLSQLVFEPVEKPAGRVIQIIYTLRVGL